MYVYVCGVCGFVCVCVHARTLCLRMYVDVSYTVHTTCMCTPAGSACVHMRAFVYTYVQLLCMHKHTVFDHSVPHCTLYSIIYVLSERGMASHVLYLCHVCNVAISKCLSVKCG